MFNGFRNAGLGETQVGRGSAKPGSASGETGGGRRGSERVVLRRLVDVLATLSLVNAAELRDLTSTVFKTYLVPSTENVADSTTTPLAQSRTSPKQSAQTLKSNSVPLSCTCW